MNLVTRYMHNKKNVNEANVSMMASNEIVLMLCSLHDLTYQMEGKMVADKEIPTTSSRVTNLITPRSATDYICFHVEGPINVCVAAVLLKIMADYTLDAIAQVIGITLKPAPASGAWPYVYL